jgi:hypothetical protein
MPRFLLILIGLLLAQAGLPAQIVLSNPDIPPHEEYVYLEKTGDMTGTTRQTVVLQSDAGRSWYEVTSQSSDSDLRYRVDAQTLSGFFSDVTERSAEAVIRRTNEVISTSVRAKADELVLSDFNSFITSLRGFPWGKAQSAKLVFVGSGAAMGGFNLELVVMGKETVRGAGVAYECWKLQMGLSGIMGGLFPKSYFWYAVKAPHCLVRFEGSRGGPGRPSTILELQSYEAGY